MLDDVSQLGLEPLSRRQVTRQLVRNPNRKSRIETRIEIPPDPPDCPHPDRTRHVFRCDMRFRLAQRHVFRLETLIFAIQGVRGIF